MLLRTLSLCRAAVLFFPVFNPISAILIGPRLLFKMPLPAQRFYHLSLPRGRTDSRLEIYPARNRKESSGFRPSSNGERRYE